MSNIQDEFFRLFLHIHHYIQEIICPVNFIPGQSDTSTAGLNSNKA